jgi:hypothetical protein
MKRLLVIVAALSLLSIPVKAEECKIRTHEQVCTEYTSDNRLCANWEDRLTDNILSPNTAQGCIELAKEILCGYNYQEVNVRFGNVDTGFYNIHECEQPSDDEGYYYYE